ncbi:hypothetical protein [Mesorhizobium japonicum]|nr:hypothetical protein [Mesorhizobium japonicum]
MSRFWYSIVFYIYCVVLAGIVLLPSYFDFADVCPAKSEAVVCLQTWVSALSGWAAFIGAVIAIPFVAAQVREARRQTEFIVGDAMPTANMHDPRETRVDNAYSTRLKIVNWNRHPILIRSIQLMEPTNVELFGVEVEDHDAGRRHILQQEHKRGRMYVPGWVDRSKMPTVAEFDLTFSTADPALIAIAQNDLVRCPITLKVEITIAGARHQTEALMVDRPDALVLAG